MTLFFFRKATYRIRYNLLAIAVVLAVASACSSSPRHNRDKETDAGEDGGADSDTDSDDTDIPWDSGTDTDLVVVEPVFLFEEAGAMSSSFDGSNVSVSWADEQISPDVYQYETVFLVFPWESPEDAMTSSFAQSPPACDGFYGSILPLSQSHAHPSGFLVLTSAHGGFVDACSVVQTFWDTSANLSDGPNAFVNLFPNTSLAPMDPHGIADDVGVVVTGSMNGIVFDVDDETDIEGTVYLDLDRWSIEGVHERLTHYSAALPFDPVGAISIGVRTLNVGTSVFLQDSVYTVFGFETINFEEYSNRSTNLVIALVDIDGNVVQEPALVENDAPPTPEGFEDTSYGYSIYSLSSNGEAILEIAKTLYVNLEGFADFNPTIMEPFPVRYWTRMLNFDGTPLSDWIEVADHGSHVEVAFPQVEWSGRYFAVCYHDPFDTFKMIAMNEVGEPVAPPINLFWEIPPVEDRTMACDILAIDEDTFIAFLDVNADPVQAYSNGLWATRVDVNVPIE
ncbi:MAG: hypothetical protein M0R80_22495 [Proteobacteria bacterium]|jgi:hypothetical protein|nr:hypothetical protein [Pseudomonadota bacterium]